MSNVYPLRTEEQMAEDASLWVTRLDRGLSAAETGALNRWLAQHPRHKHHLLETAQLWDRMDSLSVLSELFDPPVHPKRSANRSRTVGWVVAASVLVAVVALGVLTPLSPWAPTTAMDEPARSAMDSTIYETGVGAHSTVNLPDGTRMLLNTNTLVSVVYTDEQRLLELMRGELHVEVAHEPDRPLRVKAGDKVVEAVGTAFNVYLMDEKNFDVIVTEGRVKIKTLNKQASNDDGAEVQELAKGEKLSVRASLPAPVEPMEKATIDDRLSWREGNLVFRGETLREALGEVSRYTPLTFEIADERIADVRIAGLYKAGDVDGLLLALRENFRIGHSRSGDGTVVLSLLAEDAVQ
ncbi:FecR family protein [Marinimicrobium agarilyticum]|uniref:FecR family protein n=1 Tax=Marinimicrobium agarilyticum TaxID=306546 RepID=UPI000A030A4F|nr:FecR domain-containing protein [Marinimicrobium agarilyticum]